MNPLAGEARAFAHSLALDAMVLLRMSIGLPMPVIHKSPGDFASSLDTRIENHLRERIAREFPDHAFLREESGGTVAGTDCAVPLWVVDPIDGSVNFVRGYPQYCVSIALVDQGEPIAACIADPCRGEVFTAATELGSAINGRPLVAAATLDLHQAIAATVFPKPNAIFMNSYLARFGAVVTQVAGVRRAGSMALESAYLAAGRVDAFWQRGMGAWDAAAGVLLVRESGGEVFTLDGLPWSQSQEVCAAAPGVVLAWKALLADS
ncbi:MAG: inositol monophosphatase [Burkholderiaceae bacterium]|nr:MAG: inositol monophosphatase [Burkholderiaceae bacterium]TBR76620.1 MAG: inositol monophosphatase [Burkholderiaceae bacterium]